VKKTHLLHTRLSQAIAGLGHGDMMVIGDAGLPCPPGAHCIDLALTRGIPSFEQVLAAVSTEMAVEQVVLAGETRERSPHIEALVNRLLPESTAEIVSHDALKARCAHARWFVRTGEFTPYANVILVAGVVF
jgi:D-ribose pyranase